MEAELGYRLPDSYVELMSMRNGGILRRTVCNVEIDPDDGSELVLTGVFPIGRVATCSLLGECGPAGEPSVAHIDQEKGYDITPVAPDFVIFIRNLEPEPEPGSEERD